LRLLPGGVALLLHAGLFGRLFLRLVALGRAAVGLAALALICLHEDTSILTPAGSPREQTSQISRVRLPMSASSVNAGTGRRIQCLTVS
jgi:hypothetical protein